MQRPCGAGAGSKWEWEQEDPGGQQGPQRTLCSHWEDSEAGAVGLLYQKFSRLKLESETATYVRSGWGGDRGRLTQL